METNNSLKAKHVLYTAEALGGAVWNGPLAS